MATAPAAIEAAGQVKPTAAAAGVLSTSMGSSCTTAPVLRQFIVEKQGSVDDEAWNTRVLTVDPVHRCVYLSKADHAGILDHRCVVRVDSVHVWPDIDVSVFGASASPHHLERTIQLSGLVGVRSVSMLRRVLSRLSFQRREETEAREHRPAAVESALAAPMTCAVANHLSESQLIAAPALASVDDYHFFEMEEWSFRCMTLPEMSQLVAALNAVLPFHQSEIMNPQHH